ncbi:MAG TPA: ATP-binding protein [Longimicrobiales bacterium]
MIYDHTRLAELLDTCASPLLSLDDDLSIRYVNDAACTLLGRAREALVGARLPDLICKADKQMQQRMAEAEQLAAVGQLAASVAHEIGAPMTAINVSIEQLLKKECASCGFASRDLRVVLSQSKRISDLSRRLVDLAKPGQPVFETVDVNDVAREVFGLVQRTLQRAGIEATVVLADEPLEVSADAHQLQQVLLNLLLNAQKALAGAVGRIEVETRRHDSTVELIVRDSGPGIEREDLARIFRPFWSKSGGTGLGLSMARSILHAHGGSIEVRSTLGNGATFTVRLPVEAN